MTFGDRWMTTWRFFWFVSDVLDDHTKFFFKETEYLRVVFCTLDVTFGHASVSFFLAIRMYLHTKLHNQRIFPKTNEGVEL